MDETRNTIIVEGDAMSARTLILDLFDTGDPQDFSVAELVRAGAAFDIEAPGIRTALTRLKSEGRVRPVARGRYAIGANAEPLQQRILGWRTRLDGRRAWNGDWLLVIAGPQERADRTVWRRTLRALELEGFAEAETNVWARPDNLAGGADGARTRLADLEAAPSLFLCEARGLDAGRAARFRALWQNHTLRTAHRRLAGDLDRSAEAVEDMDLAAAAAETLRIGREAIRRIMRDPLLPDELCPTDALAGLVDAMIRYDRIGKRMWQAYLAG
jgi:phenylacetic acid degradation operon negative regulatory protein